MRGCDAVRVTNTVSYVNGGTPTRRHTRTVASLLISGIGARGLACARSGPGKLHAAVTVSTAPDRVSEPSNPAARQDGAEAHMANTTGKDSLVLTSTNEPPGLKVSGVLDIPDVDSFALALDEARNRVRGDVWVDLGGLRTACMEGLLAMVRTARRLAAENRRLIACSLPVPQRQLLKLAGWDHAPGLVVAD